MSNLPDIEDFDPPSPNQTRELIIRSKVNKYAQELSSHSLIPDKHRWITETLLKERLNLETARYDNVIDRSEYRRKVRQMKKRLLKAIKETP